MQNQIVNSSNEPKILGEDLIKSQNDPARTRAILLRRLQDVVGLPSSLINQQERHMAADLLIEMLRECDFAARLRCAERVALLNDAPPLLLRFLAKDEIEIARPLLEICLGFDDSDLLYVIKYPSTNKDHRILISQRKVVSEILCDALIEKEEIEVVVTILKNKGSRLSYPAVEAITAMSKTHPELITMLLKRSELRPSQALTMFWWANGDDRKKILSRFGIERITLLEAAQDLFARAAADGWQDGLVRKSLQFIERRQRNRAAAERSPYKSLEGAIEELSNNFSQELFREIAFLAGVKPACGAQILSDPGGEAIAVMCKATGLRRRYFRMLWNGLKRPMGTEAEPNEAFARTEYVYETLSTNKAQTVLRYWNWSLTSAMSPVLASKLSDNDSILDYSVSSRVSHLVFGK